jgi:plasmid stability protein
LNILLDVEDGYMSYWFRIEIEIGGVMHSITVKNIPDGLYQNLKRAAKVHHRSMNSEIIVCLEQMLQSRKMNPDEVIAQVRLLREQVVSHPISDEELTVVKRMGLP